MVASAPVLGSSVPSLVMGVATGVQVSATKLLIIFSLNKCEPDPSLPPHHVPFCSPIFVFLWYVFKRKMIVLHGSVRAFQLTFIDSGRKCSKKKSICKRVFIFLLLFGPENPPTSCCCCISVSQWKEKLKKIKHRQKDFENRNRKWTWFKCTCYKIIKTKKTLPQGDKSFLIWGNWIVLKPARGRGSAMSSGVLTFKRTC